MIGQPDGWVAALDAQLDKMGSENLLRYWPEALAPKPRTWVAENLYEGQFSDVDFALRLQPEQQA